jgi:hypothetical protein
MTKLELSKSYIYDLYNDVEHVTRLVEDARLSLDHGMAGRAREILEAAKDPASRIEMRLRDTLAAIVRANDEES